MLSIPNSSHPLFQPRQIEPDEVRWVLRRNIWTSALAVIGAGAIGGVFFTAFGLEMGMTKYHFGVLSAVLSLVGLVRLFSAAVQEREVSRKYAWFMLRLAARVLLFPLALGIFMRLSPWAIIALVGGHALLSALSDPIWQSWTWDYVPAETFGSFWARRKFWIRLSGMTFTFGAALVMDRIPSQHRQEVLAALITMLILVGGAYVFFHIRIPEPPRRARPASSMSKIAQAVRNSPFRSLLFVSALWSFAASTSTPFVVPYILDDLGLHANLTMAVALMQVVPSVCTVVVVRFWGRSVDTRHPARVMLACSFFWCLVPLLYYLVDPASRSEAIGIVALAYVIGGVFPIGFALGKVLLTARMSGKDKTMPAALMTVMASVGSMLGAALGTYFVRAAQAGGVVEFKNVFALGFAMRAIVVAAVFLVLVRRARGGEAAAP